MKSDARTSTNRPRLSIGVFLLSATEVHRPFPNVELRGREQLRIPASTSNRREVFPPHSAYNSLEYVHSRTEHRPTAARPAAGHGRFPVDDGAVRRRPPGLDPGPRGHAGHHREEDLPGHAEGPQDRRSVDDRDLPDRRHRHGRPEPQAPQPERQSDGRGTDARRDRRLARVRTATSPSPSARSTPSTRSRPRSRSTCRS